MSEVWIGLVGVVPLEGNVCLEGAKGAYVNVLAFVSTAQEYQQAVTQAVREIRLFAFEFDEIERFEDRSDREPLDESLSVLADETRRSGQVGFHEFHCFENLDG